VIVVDASAMLDVLLQTSAAPTVGRHLFSPRQTLHAPHLLDIEIVQVIRRYVLSGELDATRARGVLENLFAFQVRRYPHGVLLPRIWDLRDNFSAYDAAYVALAEVLGAPLFTRDRRLAAATRQHTSVELL
jgi:predicted nucleic acid-binding protein